MAFDIEFKGVERILKWTLVFWLPPYILWFFGKRIFARVSDWVTEPVQPTEQSPGR